MHRTRSTLTALTLSFTLVSCQTFPQDVTLQRHTPARSVTYQADFSLFPNPERGWFWPYNPECCSTDEPHRSFQDIHLNPTEHQPALSTLRDRPEKVTLVRDLIQLGMFMEGDISEGYLQEIEQNFSEVREAGLKVIVRFLYDYSSFNRDPEERVVLRHLQQLAPILQRNQDVIAWVQGGLFGGSGEGNSSDHGYVYPKHTAPGASLPEWQGLSEAGVRIYRKLLEVVPSERMVTLRYPRLKWDVLGVNSNTAQPLTARQAYRGQLAARLGFYSDGFMGDEDHFAMFVLENEKTFTEQDSLYGIFEGELSWNDSLYAKNKGQVQDDMRRYHQTALNLNATDAMGVLDAWKTNGDFAAITRNMGYRYRLVNASICSEIQSGGTFQLALTLTNDGYGRLFNPRGIQVTLQHTQTQRQHHLNLQEPQNNRLWFPSPQQTLKKTITAGIPKGMPAGTYRVLLSFPDPSPALQDRTEYKIRLANKGLWDARTGRHDLQLPVTITPRGRTLPYQGNLTFQAE